MDTKRTVVFAASLKSDRYSNLAVVRLKENGYEAIPVGFRAGQIEDIDVITNLEPIENVHTVTLYINPRRQVEYYDYIFSLHPKRIIFNPGTENLELQKMAEARGIQTQIACTLVLLNLGRY
ncbi:MAG: CoA-binding protein [Bacteroidetes bacterium]|nr:CoA-binding protein [Bacteroidota bacterium]